MQVLTKKFLSRIYKAVIEFSMLKENDHILIGLSGGKDSMLMSLLLHHLKKYCPFDFKLSAYTLNPGFDKNFPVDKLQEFCTTLNIDFYTETIELANLINNSDKSPCYTCAYFRRGTTNRIAKKLDCNKVALGHHMDDAIETFFMNITTSGQLKTFLPVTYLSKTDLTVIRPLIYYREQDIKDIVAAIPLVPIKNPCPYDGKTMRQTIKQTIKQLEHLSPYIYENLATAMRQNPSSELWQEKTTKAQDKQKFDEFWKKR